MFWLFTLAICFSMSITSCCSGRRIFCKSYIGTFWCDYSYFKVTFNNTGPSISLAAFGGHAYSRESTGSDAEYFDLLCKLYGDTNYNEYTAEELAEFESVILPNLVAIDVICNDDFNESHSKGSSLNDGMSTIAVNIQDFINNGYVNSTGGRYANGPIKLLCDLTVDDLRLHNDVIDLSFETYPDIIPSTHSLSITLTDENGKTFEYDIRCEFIQSF